MNVESFLKNFRAVTNAPHGVRGLRELVGALAIRGALIQPKEVDEDGNNLLERIHLQRELLASGGRLSRSSESSIAPETPLPFRIPATWTTASLGQVATIIRGVTFPSSAMMRTHRDDSVACLKTSNVQDEIDWQNLVFIDPGYVKRDDQWLQVGDIVMSMANSRELVGKVSLVRHVPQRTAIGGFLGILRSIVVLPEFLFVVLRSAYIQGQLREGASQTTNIANVSLAKLRPIAIPLPPLEDQKRIVAKVDELMRLCDRLQAQQQEREKLLPVLSRTSHARFVARPTQANLQAIFREPGMISPADFRQTIFSLAVSGRLVHRIPDEGDAAQLLSAEGVEPITPENAPTVPNHWQWVRLGSAALAMNSGWSPACLPQPASSDQWGILKTTAVQSLQYFEKENKRLPPNLELDRRLKCTMAISY